MHELDALRAIITDPVVACPLIFVFIRSGVAGGCPSWAHVGRGVSRLVALRDVFLRGLTRSSARHYHKVRLNGLRFCLCARGS
jgi:hypothetical protein